MPFHGKSRITAIVLACFLGGIGGHKFYLGQPAQGVLYAIFVWTFIPAFIALFEMIGYLMMTDEAFAQKYNRPT
jgi:TM2 domain-containing membrane protein YozV